MNYKKNYVSLLKKSVYGTLLPFLYTGGILTIIHAKWAYHVTDSQANFNRRKQIKIILLIQNVQINHYTWIAMTVKCVSHYPRGNAKQRSQHCKF